MIEFDLYLLQMKRLHFIFFALVLLLSQWGSLDHAFHDQDEVCDICLVAHSLDHGLATSVESVFSQPNHQLYIEITHVFTVADSVRFYPARAPPGLI